MSYMVARMQKMKAGNLGGAYKHNERVFETHSNKDIDPSRSHLNYELTDRDRSVSYERQIKDYVNENKISNRAIRKMRFCVMNGLSHRISHSFEKLSEEETREFFETAKNYFAENYGEDNIAYASVHLDESTLTCIWEWCLSKMGNCLLRQCLTKKNSKKFKKICQNT